MDPDVAVVESPDGEGGPRPADGDVVEEAGDQVTLAWDEHLRGHAQISHLFRQYAQGKVMYVPAPVNSWFVWDATRWVPDKSKSQVLAILEELLKIAHGAAFRDTDREADVRSAMSAPGARGVLELAQAKLEVKPHEIDADPYLLHCINGTLDLRTAALRPHDPDDRITKTTGVAYRRDAQGVDWPRFISSSLPDEQTRGFLQRYCGLALIGEVINHEFVIMTGKGRNGKSVFFRAMEYALGDYIATTPSDILLRGKYADTGKRSAQDNSALMSLKGRRLVGVHELQAGSVMDIATMKMLTGGESIVAKRMHQDYEDRGFTPSHTFLMLTNDLPEVSAKDDAAWMRIRVVPWTETFTGDRQDVGLSGRLAAHGEREAVLAWLVDGLREYWSTGLAAPASVMMATEEYHQDNDQFQKFLDSEMVLAETAWVPKSEFLERYEQYVRDEGGQTLKPGEIKSALEMRGVRQAKRGQRGEQTPAWVGIGIADQSQDTADPTQTP